MLEEWKEEQPEFCDEVEQIIALHHRSTHAYLIETNGYPRAKELAKAFAKYLICEKVEQSSEVEQIKNEIDAGTYADFLSITPDGAWIKKEQMLSLQDKFKTKSLTNRLRVYVIEDADKLNPSSSNSILKFLEEPQEDIVGILLTPHRYQVLSTILSRCQIFTLRNIETLEIDPVKQEALKKFLSLLSMKGTSIVAYENEFQEVLFQDKDVVKDTIVRLRQILLMMLEAKGKEADLVYEMEPFRDLLNQFSLAQLVNLIDRIVSLERELIYNVNLKLWLVKFYLKLGEVMENEKCWNSV